MRQVLILTLLLISFITNGQTRTITGKVIDEDLSPIPQARIQDRDTVELGTTDSKGEFKIELSTDTDELLLSFLGMEWTSIKLPIDCNNIEIVMLLDGIYHYKSHRKVDRIRKARFDKIPELHSKAVDLGVFKENSVCYKRTFKPDKPSLDEIRKELAEIKKQIRKEYKKMEIGDTVRIPYSGTYRSDGTDRTSLSVFAYFVDRKKFDCIIEGVITDKKRNHDFWYRVTSCDACNYKPIVYQSKEVVVGQVIRHSMGYKVLFK